MLYLLYGGFTLMTAAGNPKKVEAGKSIITNAIIGMVVVFIAFWIVQIVGAVFGLEGIQNTFVSA